MLKVQAAFTICLFLAAGCTPAGYKTVKVGPAAAPEETPAPAASEAGPIGGPSFANHFGQP